MKVVSLFVCGLVALPALAQESKPTPKPKEGAKTEKPDEQRRQAEPVLVLSPELQLRLRAVRLGEQAEHPERGHVSKVPDADQALLDIQKAVQEARSAKDVDATLKSLDEIEKAVMRARAALRKAEDKAEAKEKR